MFITKAQDLTGPVLNQSFVSEPQEKTKTEVSLVVY